MQPERNPDHDYTDDANQATFLRMYEDMKDYDAHPTCRYCTEERRPVAMTGPAWGWESIHDQRCPENVDNQPVAAVRVTQDFNGAEYSEAEAIWAASQDTGHQDEDAS